MTEIRHNYGNTSRFLEGANTANVDKTKMSNFYRLLKLRIGKKVTMERNNMFAEQKKDPDLTIMRD